MSASFRHKLLRTPVATVALAGGRLLHPSILALLGRDGLGATARPGDSERHLEATMQWLCRAQDHGGGQGGVSAGYSLLQGWLDPYPETTGYIIPTFFDYAQRTQREEFRHRAIRMADWEIAVQMPLGAVQAGLYRGEGRARRPAVFNTGQAIFGWCRAFAETSDGRYLEAAIRAGNWLLNVQGPDGAWHRSEQETETGVHAYDARTAWSLLELSRHVRDERYRKAARANLEWTLSKQRENGWFEHNAFFVSGDKWNLPLTHTIAYVLEGLEGAWRILGDPRYWKAAQKTAERLMRIFELRRRLPGEFDESWKSKATYTCLTGNAQTAGIWLRLYESSGDARYLNAALKLNDAVKATQSLHSIHGGIRGGVKGSQPIFGRYTRFTFVNWGAKFLADALMLEDRMMAAFQEAVLRGERTVPASQSVPAAIAVSS